MANHLSTYDRTQKKVFELLRQVEDYDALPTDVKNKCLSAIDKAVAYKCRTDFFAFVRAVSPFIIDGFEPGRHIEIICKELQELAHSIWRNTGHAIRVQISMCPGGSKSHICTRLFPAWVIGNWPNARIMLVGHSIDFARDEFSAKVRDIVWLDQYQKIFPGTILREDKTSAGRFLTTKRGEVQAASLDGKVAGRRAHLIINDDSLVEEDALSKTICKQKVQRYMPNIRSRLLTRPDCAELLVGTRWVIGDLFDYLEKEDKRSGSPWKVLKIPALLTTEASKLLRRPGDPDGYLTPGTSFWPEFQPTTKLESIRSSFQNNISRWNAVYQQNPTPQDGSLVSPEWFSHWREPELPQFKSIWVTADTAYTKGTQSDFTAIQVWGVFNHTSQQGGGVQVTRPNCMLIEHEKGKWEFPELIDKFQDYREKYDPDGIIIEDRSSGLALIPDLIKRGFPIKPWKTSADKVARMQTTAPFLRSGRFWVQMPREDEALIQKSFDWVGEICMFPDGPHDDEADALTQFVLFMRDENKLTDVGYTREEDWEDYEDDDDVAGVTRITNYASSLM